MALSTPPTAPQRGDRATFASRVDAFITWLIGFVSELNIFSANLNSIAAGGAYSIPYKFDNTTNLFGTSGGGILALQPSLTQIYVDTKDAAGGAAAARLVGMVTGNTGAVKGQVRIVKQGDPSKWMMFNLLSYAEQPGGLYGLAQVDAFASSGMNPFVSGDSIILFYNRAGDKGDTGPAGSLDVPTIYVREEYANNTAPSSSSFNNGTRLLNAVKVNTISGASLASSKVTLPVGRYRFLGSAPSANALAHRVTLYNETDAAVVEYGSSEYSGTNSGYDATRSFVRGIITISASKTFTLRHFTGGSSSAAGGYATGLAGGVEAFAELLFEKIA